MNGPVQTKCACGHSLAAHQGGPCQGVDVFGGDRSTAQHRGMALCPCTSAHDTFTVPAAHLSGSR